MYRRRRRYSNSRAENSEYDLGSNTALLAEFMFFNTKGGQVIPENVLKDIKKKLENSEQVYWTNKDFATHGIGFKVWKWQSDEDKQAGNNDKSILISMIDYTQNSGVFKLDLKTYNKVVHNIGKMFFTFELTDFQHKWLNYISFEDDNYFKICEQQTMNSWDDVLKFLFNHEIKIEKCDDFSEVLGILNMLVPEAKIDTKEQAQLGHRESHNSSYDSIYINVKVVEKRIHECNFRLCVYKNFYSYYRNRYSVRIYREDHPEYNYQDEKTIMFDKYEYNDKKNCYYLDRSLTEINEKQEVVTNLDAVVGLSEYISDVIPKGEYVVSLQVYKFYQERVSKRSVYEVETDTREAAINDRYRELIKDGKDVKIMGVTVSLNKIQLDDEGFVISFKDDFLDVCGSFFSIKNLLKENDVRYNFNLLYEKILQLSGIKVIDMDNVQDKEYKEFEELEFKVNNIPIKIQKENNKIKINGIFCRIADVYDILKKAICFRDAETFDAYIKDVSFIGIEWKKLINNGINITLQNNLINAFNKASIDTFSKLTMRFSLYWDTVKRRDVYIKINDKKYLINQKRKFLKFFNVPNKHLNMLQLKQSLKQCIEFLDDDVLIGIVVDAVEEERTIQRKAKVLIENTVRDTGAKLVEIFIMKMMRRGYLIKGRVSGADYFINEKNLEVYKKINGQWNKRCVVDDSSKVRIFEDRLANRIVNIYNEPERIYTIHETQIR